MNRRLRLDDLDNPPYKELIQSLTLQWVRAELPHQGLTYTDYQTDIRILLLTIKNLDRTKTLVQAVLAQAAKLNKTSG